MTPLLRVLPLALLIAGLLAQTCGGQSQRAQQTADAQHSHQTPLFSAEFPHGSGARPPRFTPAPSHAASPCTCGLGPGATVDTAIPASAFDVILFRT